MSLVNSDKTSASQVLSRICSSAFCDIPLHREEFKGGMKV